MTRNLWAALGWRLRAKVGDAAVDRVWVRCGLAYRPWLKRPRCIGVAGSAGKTTAKELLQGILSQHLRGEATRASLNAVPEVAKMVVRLRPWHDYGLVEISEDRPGVMAQNLALLQPSVALITLLRDDHAAAFTHPQGIAEELAALVRGLPAHGTAVLNADDAPTLALAAECRGSVLTYGLAAHADLRAEEVRSNWPDRLTLTLVHGNQRVRATTQLCGNHWVTAVLGAVGVALVCGLSLQQCADALSRVPAFDGRMQPVTTADGLHFIRDDFKAPMWTLDACVNFLSQAQAPRKWVVLGEVSDKPKGASKEKHIAKLVQRLADVSDEVLVVGPWATVALEVQGRASGRVWAFDTVWRAQAHLAQHAKAGDLVLLKGTGKIDHLQRLVLARSNEVRCWQDDCRREQFCSDCPDRMQDRRGQVPGVEQQARWDREVPSVPWPQLGPRDWLVIGLGNPGDAYLGTPHNAGAEALSAIVRSGGGEWTESPAGAWAAVTVAGCSLLCLQPKAPVNWTGEIVVRLMAHLGLPPERVLLVHDDLALSLGKVQVKMHGHASGHRGVASVLVHAQSDRVRRVRIGVKPEAGPIRADYVTAPLPNSALDALRACHGTVAERIAEIVPLHLPG